MSENDKHTLCVKLPKKLIKELNIEIVKKHGKTYGNVPKCITEAIELWISKSKKE